MTPMYFLSGLLLVLLSWRVSGLEIKEYPAGGVQAGQTYTIIYSPADNTLCHNFCPPERPVNQSRDYRHAYKYDPSNHLQRALLISRIATATGGTFLWTVDRNLANGADYALEIRRSGQSPNFSGQFGLTGGSNTGTSSSAQAISSVSVRSTAPSSTISSTSSSSSTSTTAVSTQLTSTTPTATSIPTISTPMRGSARTSSFVTSVGLTTTEITSTRELGPQNTDTGDRSGGLSTGAKAGIGVGATIAGLLLALGAFFLGMSVRKKTRTNGDTDFAQSGAKPELDGEEATHPDTTSELGTDAASGQDRNKQTYELAHSAGEKEVNISTIVDHPDSSASLTANPPSSELASSSPGVHELQAEQRHAPPTQPRVDIEKSKGTTNVYGW